MSNLWELKDLKPDMDKVFERLKEELDKISKSFSVSEKNLIECDTEESEYDSYKDECYETENDEDHTDDDEQIVDRYLPQPACICARPALFKVLRRLPSYPPSNEMKEAQTKDFSALALSENNKIFGAYLATQHQLNAQNIHDVFTILLQIEDLTILADYVELAQRNVILATTETKWQYSVGLTNAPRIDDLVTPFLDEMIIVPRAGAGCTLPKYPVDILMPHYTHDDDADEEKICVATMEQVSKERVVFRKKKAFVPTDRYDVIFRPSRLPLRYQRRALELLAENAKVRHYLFPMSNPNKQLANIDLQLVNTVIGHNPEQLQAVRNIVEGPNPYAPYIIFGPPGTGKTTTIVEAIIQLRLRDPRSRILVTAGSNSACDTIALRICKYFNSSPRLRAHLDSKPLIRIFSKSIVQKGIQLIDSELLANSNCDSGEHIYPDVQYIRRYGIIVATLCVCGKLVTGDIGVQNFFTHIFIDEAGASTEPETLVGIMGLKSNTCRVILCGDHKQLGPVLKSERAAGLGLEQSMMERLLGNACYALDGNGNYDRTLQMRLRRNFRSHPEIVRLYNHLYYNNELLAEAPPDNLHTFSNWHVLANSQFPIIFQAVHGKTAKVEGSPSSCNNLEVQVLMWYLQRLLVDGVDGQQVDQSDIGIITPYRLQARLIQQQLSQRSWLRVEAGSVETFQGREKTIIIVSFVRSFAGLGFVRQPRRLNVILSRAKSMLILIGNPLTLRRNSDFKFLIEECTSKGTLRRKKKEDRRLHTRKLPSTLAQSTESIKVVKLAEIPLKAQYPNRRIATPRRKLTNLNANKALVSSTTSSSKEVNLKGSIVVLDDSEDDKVIERSNTRKLQSTLPYSTESIKVSQIPVKVEVPGRPIATPRLKPTNLNASKVLFSSSTSSSNEEVNLKGSIVVLDDSEDDRVIQRLNTRKLQSTLPHSTESIKVSQIPVKVEVPGRPIATPRRRLNNLNANKLQVSSSTSSSNEEDPFKEPVVVLDDSEDDTVIVISDDSECEEIVVKCQISEATKCNQANQVKENISEDVENSQLSEITEKCAQMRLNEVHENRAQIAETQSMLHGSFWHALSLPIWREDVTQFRPKAAAQKRYSKSKLLKYNTSICRTESDLNRDTCHDLENNKNLLNTSVPQQKVKREMNTFMDKDGQIESVQFVYDFQYNPMCLLSPSLGTFCPTEMLQKIVRRCDNCPLNYIPVTSKLPQIVLRYTKDNLLKLRQS